MNNNYLFVYGTLLKDVENEMSKFLAKYSELVGKGYFYGKLYEVSWYPGAVLSNKSSERVYGHVYKLDNEDLVFKVLDAYEGIDEHQPQTNLFRKELVTVFLDNNSEQKAWIYLYNHTVKNLNQIFSGDYLNPDINNN